MNEDTANRTLRGVKCEKHGLRYDPSTQNGCALCRREAAGTPVAASTSMSAAASAGTSAGTPAAGGSLGAALGVTAVLLALTTFGLYALHGTMAGMLKGFAPAAQRQDVRPFDLPTIDPGGPDDVPDDGYRPPKGD